jgi:hypothetical protein
MSLYSRNIRTYLLATVLAVPNNLSLFKDKSHKTSFFLTHVIPLYTTEETNQTSLGYRILEVNSGNNYKLTK